jgi:hypothetical protein
VNIPLIGISIWSVIKIFVLISMLLYIAFALVIVRQVQLMTKTLKVGFEFPVKTLALLHLVSAAVLFALALIVL